MGNFFTCFTCYLVFVTYAYFSIFMTLDNFSLGYVAIYQIL